MPDLSPLCPIDWLESFSSTSDCESFTHVSKFLTVPGTKLWLVTVSVDDGPNGNPAPIASLPVAETLNSPNVTLSEKPLRP